MKVIKTTALQQKQHHHFQIILVSSLFFAVMPGVTSAAGVTNGDFSTGDFTGWSQDSDGLGSPTQDLNDFTIVEATPGNPASRVEVDHFATAGDTNSTPQDEVLFANTLFQGLDLTLPADATSQKWQLSFDWTFGGEQADFDDNFLVALSNSSGNFFDEDGDLGFLFNPTSYGFGTFSTLLDASFANAAGWTLEFQLNRGVDGNGSFFQIDNVDLTADTDTTTPNLVPLPAAFWLFGSSLVGLGFLNRRARTLVV